MAVTEPLEPSVAMMPLAPLMSLRYHSCSPLFASPAWHGPSLSRAVWSTLLRLLPYSGALHAWRSPLSGNTRDDTCMPCIARRRHTSFRDAAPLRRVCRPCNPRRDAPARSSERQKVAAAPCSARRTAGTTPLRWGLDLAPASLEGDIPRTCPRRQSLIDGPLVPRLKARLVIEPRLWRSCRLPPSVLSSSSSSVLVASTSR